MGDDFRFGAPPPASERRMVPIPKFARPIIPGAPVTDRIDGVILPPLADSPVYRALRLWDGMGRPTLPDPRQHVAWSDLADRLRAQGLLDGRGAERPTFLRFEDGKG